MPRDDSPSPTDPPPPPGGLTASLLALEEAVSIAAPRPRGLTSVSLDSLADGDGAMVVDRLSERDTARYTLALEDALLSWTRSRFPASAEVVEQRVRAARRQLRAAERTLEGLREDVTMPRPLPRFVVLDGGRLA